MTRRPKDAVEAAITEGNRKRFGAKFKAARLACGMSQVDVAVALKHGPSGQAYISDVEAGRVNLTLDMISWLAAIVGSKPAALLDDAPPAAPPPAAPSGSKRTPK